MRMQRRLTVPLALAAVILTVSACVTPTPTLAPVPTFPVPPEVLPTEAAAIPAEYGSATWALDPAFPTPDAASVELHLLVWETACSGGTPATGRISAPLVEYDSAAVTITLGVRPIALPSGMLVTCPGPPGTPAILHMSQPLGARQLLDGGCAPPVVRASSAIMGNGCHDQ